MQRVQAVCNEAKPQLDWHVNMDLTKRMKAVAIISQYLHNYCPHVPHEFLYYPSSAFEAKIFAKSASLEQYAFAFKAGIGNARNASRCSCERKEEQVNWNSVKEADVDPKEIYKSIYKYSKQKTHEGRGFEMQKSCTALDEPGSLPATHTPIPAHSNEPRRAVGLKQPLQMKRKDGNLGHLPPGEFLPAEHQRGDALCRKDNLPMLHTSGSVTQQHAVSGPGHSRCSPGDTTVPMMNETYAKNVPTQPPQQTAGGEERIAVLEFRRKYGQSFQTLHSSILSYPLSSDRSRNEKMRHAYFRVTQVLRSNLNLCGLSLGFLERGETLLHLIALQVHNNTKVPKTNDEKLAIATVLLWRLRVKYTTEIQGLHPIISRTTLSDDEGMHDILMTKYQLAHQLLLDRSCTRADVAFVLECEKVLECVLSRLTNAVPISASDGRVVGMKRKIANNDGGTRTYYDAERDPRVKAKRRRTGQL